MHPEIFYNYTDTSKYNMGDLWTDWVTRGWGCDCIYCRVLIVRDKGKLIGRDKSERMVFLRMDWCFNRELPDGSRSLLWCCTVSGWRRKKNENTNCCYRCTSDQPSKTVWWWLTTPPRCSGRICLQGQGSWRAWLTRPWPEKKSVPSCLFYFGSHDTSVS